MTRIRRLAAPVLLLCVPWLPGIVLAWRDRPRDGAIPPSMGDRATDRLR
jgi:hypothetical protein